MKLRDMLYTGCTAPILGHLMLCNSPSRPRPINQARWTGYDQHNQDDINAHCVRTKAIVDGVIINCYGIDSFEDVALNLYLAPLRANNLSVCINIDKGVYEKSPSPYDTIQSYLTYLKTSIFPKSINLKRKSNGKIIVSHFVNGDEDPLMFEKIRNSNTAFEFVYNDPRMGPNVMWWPDAYLEQGLDWWIRQPRAQGALLIPGVTAGLDDTLMRNAIATCVWNANLPARVYPSTGPSFGKLLQCCAVINKYYNANNQPEFIQGITLNDLDEGTGMEPRADGTGGILTLPPPVVCTRGELWMDGNKLCDVSTSSEVTINKVYSDNSVVKQVTNFKS